MKKHLAYLLVLFAGCSVSVLGNCGSTQTLTPCLGEEIVLRSSYKSDDKSTSYQWYLIMEDGSAQVLEGKITAAIPVAADDEAIYRCEVVVPSVTIAKNLMENGDFETVPDGVKDGDTSPRPPYFTSGCAFFEGWAVPQNPTHWTDHYAMVHNAKDYNAQWWVDLDAHSGDWFVVFDPATKKYVWQAETKDNPRLKVEKGKEYVFGYYAANAAADGGGPALLRFMIDNLEDTEAAQPLGEKVAVQKTEWQYHELTWTAPYTSNNMAITIYDENTSADWNDFCLDDIFFQPKPESDTEIVCADTFLIQPQACCEDMVKEERDTTVCASALPLVWDEMTFEQEGTQIKSLSSETDPDCIVKEITYTLSLAAGVEMCAKWDDVIYVPNRDSLYTSYQWYVDGVPIAGATDQFYHAPEGLRGLYHCVMQTVSGNEETTCPAAFDTLEHSADHNPGDTPRQLVSKRAYPIDAHLTIIVFTYDDHSVVAEKHWTR